MSLTTESKKIFRNSFISGLLVIVPLILTFVLLRALVESIDGLVRPAVIKLLGHAYDFPFVGIIITLVLIIFTGFLAANVLGKRLIRFWEFLLLHIPLVNFVYGSAKQFIQAITVPQNKIFKSVVLVEYPRPGIYAMGFLANRSSLESQGTSRQLLCVFIPSTPTPFTGIAIFFPEEQVIFLDMSIEDGIKFSVSGGIISPVTMRQYIKSPDLSNDGITEQPINDKH